MPSSFPRMDPYLEQQAFWPSFHSRFMVALADAIERDLAPAYYIEVEARTYLDDSEAGVLIGIPDAVIAAKSAEDQTLFNPEVSPVAVQVKPQQVEVPIPEEVTERYLEIRELETGAVITAIELLSPKNKRSGKGRATYIEKRTQIFGSDTHLVELDLLQAGVPMPVAGSAPTLYRILVSPSWERPKADLYGFGLQQSLPEILIPLKYEDEPIAISLQPIFEGVYDRGRYAARIDYAYPPASPLSEADQAWLTTHLQSKAVT